MLVMEYMDYGSLYDVLHNDTMPFEGDLLLPILRDIAQGIRFLHAADPQVIHGDLKAANILIDCKFRAKVADFGLSMKEKLGRLAPLSGWHQSSCGEKVRTRPLLMCIHSESSFTKYMPARIPTMVSDFRWLLTE